MATTAAGNGTPPFNTSNEQGLTSFGFLQEGHDTPESSFALGSLFNRVKSALTVGLAVDATSSSGTGADNVDTFSSTRHSSGTYSAPSSSRTPYLSPRIGGSPNIASASHHGSQYTGADRLASMQQHRKASMARPIRGLSNIDEHPESIASPPSRSGFAEAGPSRPRNEIMSPRAAASTRDSVVAPSATSGGHGHMRPSQSTTSIATSRASSGVTSNAGSSFSRGLPLMLRSAAPAPAVTFTAPATAINARSHIASTAGSHVDDRESVVADDGDMDPDSSRDTLSVPRGGLDGAYDRSHLARYGWSAIPGFLSPWNFSQMTPGPSAAAPPDYPGATPSRITSVIPLRRKQDFKPAQTRSCAA